tara:strand:- start:478 stop:1416 length:939 start_codon:yes stop_codon:yes gene_type:complete
MKVGFQLDPIESLNLKTDSTLPIIFESQKRKNRNFYYLPGSLTFKNNSVYAMTREVKFKKNNLNDFSIGKLQSTNLDKFDYIFVRQDPPYNMEYISSMHLLEQISHKVRIINNPQGIRNAPEKISMLKYKNIIPPTIITRSKNEVNLFLNKHGTSVIKPLYGNGGEGVFLLSKKDKNFNQIVENFILNKQEPFILQKFISQVKDGDKRIILIDGEPVAAIKRMPKRNEIRSNIHVGGNCEKTKLTKQDEIICNEIKNYLKTEGLFFVGIDVIGKYLIEINVTSPTCIQEIKRLYKIDIASFLWDKLDQKTRI